MAEENSITFLWKIVNFSHCVQEQQEYLESPEFYVNCLTESAWTLRLYPRGTNSEREVTVYLHNKCYNENSVLFINYEISFLSVDGSILFSEKIENLDIVIGETYRIFSYPRIDEVIQRIDEFLPQDTLTVQCRIWKARKNLTQSVNYVAHTRIGLQQRSFHWAIAEFSKFKINEKKVHRFIMDKDQPTFFTEMFLSSVTVREANIEFYIRQIKKNISKFFATCKVSVLDAKGQIVKSMEGSHWFKPENNNCWPELDWGEPDNSIWQFPRFITKNEVKASPELMVDDTLNLFFNLIFTTGIVYSNIECVSSMPNWLQKPPENTIGIGKAAQDIFSDKLPSLPRVKNGGESLSSLQEDLLSLYMDKTLCDFELRTGSESIPVHKSVLAARSPVFKAMFTSDMKEGVDKFIDIPDLDGETLDRLLLFMYTGSVEELGWLNTSKLYYAADKYDILSLKQKCCTSLTDSIASNNVCEILILADRHNDERLKSSVHDFIMNNDKNIIRSVEWKQFLLDNTALAAETLQLIYSKKLDVLAK